jgi:hypothetical protein
LKHGPQSLKLGVLQSKHGLLHPKHGPLGQEYCSLVEGVTPAPIFWLNCFEMFQWSHHDVELSPLIAFAPSNQFHQPYQYLDGFLRLPKVLVGS